MSDSMSKKGKKGKTTAAEPAASVLPDGTDNAVQPAATPHAVVIDYQPQWSPWARQFMTVVLVIGGIYALTLLAPVIQVLITSFLLAFIMFLPSRMLAARTPLNFTGAVVILYLLLIVLIVLLILVFVPPFVDGLGNLVKSAIQGINDLQKALQDYRPEQGVITIFNVRVDLNDIIKPIRDLIVGASGTDTGTAAGSVPIKPADIGQAIPIVTSTAASLLGSVFQFITTALLSLFISFLVLLELPFYQRLLYRSVARSYQREIRILIRRVVNVWLGFLRGQVIVGLIIGALTWLQLRLMGIQGAGALAISTALISLIPNIGGIIALGPLGIVPLLQGSSVMIGLPNTTVALLVVVGNLVISQVIWNVVAPKILGDALSLPLPVIIVGVVIGTALGGILGAFLIAPILGTLRVLVLYTIQKIFQQDPFPGEEMPELGDLTKL